MKLETCQKVHVKFLVHLPTVILRIVGFQIAPHLVGKYIILGSLDRSPWLSQGALNFNKHPTSPKLNSECTPEKRWDWKTIRLPFGAFIGPIFRGKLLAVKLLQCTHYSHIQGTIVWRNCRSSPGMGSISGIRIKPIHPGYGTIVYSMVGMLVPIKGGR